MDAARNGNAAEVVALCNADSNAVHSKDDAGTTALILAARNGHAEVVRILIAARADVLCQVNSGYTAIHAAAQGCRISALLEANADLKLTSQAGFTPLHFAATSGNADLVQLLLQARAAVRSRTSKGKTALKLASARDDAEVVQVLRDAA
ncbi:unnamed protein product [Polarella glacialis]|uniref:Uncharacterized protein n=1 Tax=Polarella glacialis TaxID=89957 RepID=A0A813DU14_POLGL|nr:unnamed protein product [Polarella glacialis]